jgi:hypothetical protein
VPKSAQGKAAIAAVTTHLLSDTPTEFHVFESHLSGSPVFVMTRLSAWRVQQDDIELLVMDRNAVSPQDHPAPISREQASQQEKELAPLIAKARETYPAARERFIHGLAPGEHFAVVTRLTEESGRFEQVFVTVSAVHGGQIEGRISSQIEFISGYKYGDPYSFPESKLIDWVISKEDGSEEGNLIGKYLDSRR